MGSVPCHPVTDSAHSRAWRKVFSEHQHPMGTVWKTATHCSASNDRMRDNGTT